MLKRPIHLSHDFLAEVVDKSSVVVDATMGNGNDTAFLAQLAKKVYAFDVQEQAIRKTSERLAQLGLSNAELILAGHEAVDQYVTEPVRAAIFNLGYLPSADKSIITLPNTTLQALSKLL
ncbi:TPA: class I SAM-dependent methyltransferase, partial [Streptococcus pyogenes]